jgi:hypothetical protein
MRENPCGNDSSMEVLDKRNNKYAVYAKEMHA